jgi:hypothetical protein
MSRNDIILGAVALVLVAFSLLVSMVIPRRNPEFPGRHLKLFTLVCVLLVIAMLAAVELFGAEEGHGAQEEENVATAVQDSGEPDAEEGSETGAQTEAGETGETAGGDPAAGEEIFASAGSRTATSSRRRAPRGRSARTSTRRAWARTRWRSR